MTALLIAMLVAGLILIPFGMPGMWLMIAAVLIGAAMHQIGIVVTVVCIAIAVVAEIIEFVIVKRLTAQYGGSRKAFWGAIAGGVAGVIVGVPVPVIGSVIAGMLGSFAGAALVTFAETRHVGSAHRVGWGAVVGRAFSAITKTAAGVTILVLAAAALLR